MDEWTTWSNCCNRKTIGTTTIERSGADGYAEFLSDDFSQWTIGSTKINYKDEWVEGVKEWFDDAWCVSERKVKYCDILVSDHFAFTCRIVDETYSGTKEKDLDQRLQLLKPG